MTYRPNGKRWPWAACVLLAACSVRSVAADANPTVPIPISDLIGAIDNHDVRWDGALVGLLPELNRRRSGLVEKHYARDVSGQLLKALDDPERFVAAHVLLGRLNRTKVRTSGAEYDGLRVVLYFDGKTVIDAEQRTGLKKRWIERLSKPPTR